VFSGATLPMALVATVPLVRLTQDGDALAQVFAWIAAGFRNRTAELPLLLRTKSMELSVEKASHSPAELICQEAVQGEDDPFAEAVDSSVAITKYAPKSGSVPALFIFALPEVMSAKGTVSELRRRNLRALPASPVVLPPTQPDSDPVTQLSVRAGYVSGTPPETGEPYTEDPEYDPGPEYAACPKAGWQNTMIAQQSQTNCHC